MANNGASQQNATGNDDKSAQTFVTALVLQLIIAGVYLFAFSAVHKRVRKTYEPRTYLAQPGSRIDPVPPGFIAWLPHVIRHSMRPILANNGLDAYMFVRFLWMNLLIFTPFFVISWIILLPVDGTSTGGLKGIGIFTIGNIGNNQQPRLAAHLILAWLFTFWVFFLIRREAAKFATLRHEWLLSKATSRDFQPRTVLVTGLPADLLTDGALIKALEPVGAVEKVWLARDFGDDLQDAYDRRLDACNKLEAAECKAIKAVAKKAKKGKLAADRTEDLETLLEKKERPSGRLGKIPCVGRKVDTINWAKGEIAETNGVLGERIDVESKPAVGSAFVLFHRQVDAHAFAVMPPKELPFKATAEVHPEDVIWQNLKMKTGQRKIRNALGWAATIALVILWAIPVAFVGLVSNVSYLCTKAPFLAWLCKLPTPVNGIIQGALPPVALAVLFMLLPIVLRLFARLGGLPLTSLVERSLMTRYFLFTVIHGFLIVTLASSLVAAIPQIVSNPSSAVSLLATYLPQIHVLDQPAFMETGGMFFPQAINQMFVGLYIEELCLCGLFFLKGANDGGDKAAAFPLGGLMVLLIVLTILFHIYVVRHFGPQWKGLPRSAGDRAATAESNGAAPLGEDLANAQTLVADARNGGYYDSDLSTSIEHAYMPTCTYERQRPIWLPADTFGIGRSEVADLRKRDIAATTSGANADEKATISIERPPPELPWTESASGNEKELKA